MKRTLLSLGLCLSVFLSFGQHHAAKGSENLDHDVEKCSQHHRMKEMQMADPERYTTVFRAPVLDEEKATGVIYTIPVVFHIIHNNGSENVSDAQIQDALNILNRDYRRLNADADNVHASFQGMPTDAEINFVFATVAPNGACFSGITRTVSSATNSSNGQAQVDAVVAGNNVYQGIWPHNKYLNIYVCKQIGGAAGYTFLPNGGATANVTNMYYNGIFILHNYCGSIGTGSVGTSRALTHEVGHWLNLSHTWGDDNTPGVACGNDYVSDTPITKGFTSCPNPNNAKICNASIVENYENYMDYSYCSKMFTPGQVTRMRAALTSSTGGRNNIWTPANLALVGGGSGTSLCALDFTASQTTVCAGVTVTYSPSQTSGIASYSWTFPGGTPSSSTAPNPTVTYSTPGTYNATLVVTASSNGASYTKTKSNYITVNSNTTVNLPLTEGFTSTTFPPSGWTIVNVGASGTWTRSTSAGLAPTPGNSLKFDNYNIQTGNDEIRLPKVNMAAYSAATLKFDVAYAPYDSQNYDGLEVLVSTDCGETFTSVYAKSNTVLATANATTGSFTPTTSQWRSETVDLSPYVGNSSVWIAFKNIAGWGNNLYIDNINVTGVSGTPPAPVASFTSSGTTVCAGQTVTYTSTSTGNPTGYSWTFPGGTPSTSSVANPTVTYNTPGTYNASLTVTNAGGSNSATQTNLVTVNPIPTAPTISAVGSLTFCQGGSVTLTSSANSGNTWSNGSTSSSITVSTSGTYTVKTTQGGCVSPNSNGVTVQVNPNPTVTFSSIASLCNTDAPITLTQGAPAGGTYSGTGVSGNTFDPSVPGVGNVQLTYTYTTPAGCTGTATRMVTVTNCTASLSEEAANGFALYPNPTKGMVTVEVTNDQIKAVMVMDASGKLVYSASSLHTTKEEIQLDQFAHGVYTVRIETEQGVQHLPVILE